MHGTPTGRPDYCEQQQLEQLALKGLMPVKLLSLETGKMTASVSLCTNAASRGNVGKHNKTFESRRDKLIRQLPPLAFSCVVFRGSIEEQNASDSTNRLALTSFIITSAYRRLDAGPRCRDWLAREGRAGSDRSAGRVPA